MRFLLQYLAQGGQVLNEAGRPYLDSAIMAGVLTVYRQAVDAGVVPIAIRNLQTRKIAGMLICRIERP